MKVINIRDKSLFDIARNIASILGVSKYKTTDDKNGVIIERVNQERNIYHYLFLKKNVDLKTKNVSFYFETDEGELNPLVVKNAIRLKNLETIVISFPNIMAGEEKKILFSIKDANGKKNEIELRKETFKSHVGGSPNHKPQKQLKLYKKDDIIFKEDDIGKEMYIIQKGKIGLFKNTKEGMVELCVMEVSNFFGEMALFGDSHRSATAKVIENSDLLVISKGLFDTQLNKVPSWFITMFKAIIERLKNTDKLINDLKHQISELQNEEGKESGD